MDNATQRLIEAMTLEEKASLCSGLDFWRTKPIKRLDIPSIRLADGPHGLRIQAGGSDHLGLNNSIPATCFPTEVALSCSWDEELIRRVGVALGRECRAQNVALLLGPGVNIKRSPLCGRNFEYFSEDPFLSSALAAAYINGVQSQGVGTVIKHFAANNQETRRMSVDVNVDERALHEIYLASFETAITQAQPWGVMCAYNKVNGTFASENAELLTDVLRNTWQYDGIVVSDWGAVNDRAAALDAGLELDMPGNDGRSDQRIIDAVNNGLLSTAVLDRAVARLLKLIRRATTEQPQVPALDMDKHHLLAREAASESIVLLKNDTDLLPLPSSGNFAIIGELAKNLRYQGSGSSRVNPTKIDTLVQELQRAGGSALFHYSAGYRLNSEQIDLSLLDEAVILASKSDAAILFLGLPDDYETEGVDRNHLCIPATQVALIEAVSQVQDNIIVVLSNGSPIEMPWVVTPKAIIESYLGGQAMAAALADILFGHVNPSGKLTETFPERLEHTPCHLNFPGTSECVEYREGVFVGYRYYDKKGIEPLFSFGHGLSYTSFEYSSLKLSHEQILDSDQLEISVTVKNTGKRAGKEIVQLYVSDTESSLIRPDSELKGFKKIALEPGESKQVSFSLNRRAFSFYDPKVHDWHLESGWFEVLIGRSSRDIVARAPVEIVGQQRPISPIHANSTIGDILKHPALVPFFNDWLESLSEKGNVLKMLRNGEPWMEELTLQLPLRTQSDYSEKAPNRQELQCLIDSLNHLLQQQQG
ncbi:beta-glucosidase [Marinobacterium sedimentorum]|uniref:beta-glucosidase n=1 Tax=Marinobacterium sedimentorum TaxID=2927804 RepID=UPI0020C60DE0|nr:glycoside hydrolase family 3 C-terminal domain-containing protein [Marinobacterium sedimentorum]MCP8688704.1 glycoside hydrolase family 3 C-terminal domain-containing protein [Marinobacterium sedimentorum]